MICSLLITHIYIYIYIYVYIEHVMIIYIYVCIYIRNAIILCLNETPATSFTVDRPMQAAWIVMDCQACDRQVRVVFSLVGTGRFGRLEALKK